MMNQSLEQISDEIRVCNGCRLNGYPCVLWEHTCDKPAIAIVGEAPGAEEAKEGHPFVGKSGKMVRQMLHDLGCSYYITNAVKCHPPRNRTPDNTMIKACSKFLRKEISAIEPCIVVTLGNTAHKAITGEEGSLAHVGCLFEHNGRIIYHLPHPAYILRNPTNTEELWKKPIQKLRTILKRIEEGLNYEQIRIYV